MHVESTYDNPLVYNPYLVYSFKRNQKKLKSYEDVHTPQSEGINKRFLG